MDEQRKRYGKEGREEICTEESEPGGEESRPAQTRGRENAREEAAAEKIRSQTLAEGKREARQTEASGESGFAGKKTACEIGGAPAESPPLQGSPGPQTRKTIKIHDKRRKKISIHGTGTH
jgi:hypothetical protein